MPKISIREIDNTGSEVFEYDDYCVLVPGLKFECELPKEGCTGTLDGHYDNFQSFRSALETIFEHQSLESGAPAVDPKFMDDIGFITACECLRNGLSVQYVGAYNSPNAEDLNYVESGFYDDLFNEYTDKGKYDIRFITIGGLKSDDARIAALNAAATRGDAKAILDVNEDSFENIKSSGDYTNATEAWLADENGIGPVCADKIERTGTSGSNWTVQETKGRYGQLLAPRAMINIHKAHYTNGKFGFETKLTYVNVPASLIYLASFGKHVISGNKKFNPWYAISGSVRGKSPYKIALPTVDFGDADVDILQVRSGEEHLGHVATNVIANIRPFGYVLWGSRSMQPLSKPESDSGDLAVQLTAASFANIRELCSAIKKTLYRASRRYSFEPNSDELWFNFKAAITPLLEKMKSDQGIRGYKIDKVPTNKKALMIAVIKIVPIEPVEDFDLTVEMSDTIDVVTE